MQSPQHLDWNDLKVFVTYLRCANLKAAARTLGINASTVSRRLAALEHSLGTRLFDRTPEGLKPTEAARTLLPRAELAESAANDVLRTMSGRETELAGVVTVAMPDALAVHGLMPLVSALRVRTPGIQLAVVTGARQVDLLRQEADIAIRTVRPVHAELVARQLGVLQYRPLASSAYLAKLPRRVSPRELDWLTDVVQSQWLQHHLHGVRPAVTASNLMCLISAAANGLGVAMLPDGLCHAIPSLQVVSLPFDDPPAVPVWLVAHEAARRVPRIAAVWDFMVETLPTQLGLGRGPHPVAVASTEKKKKKPRSHSK